MVVLIPTANTMNYGDTLRCGAILEHNVAFCGTGGADQSLKFKAGDNIIEALVAILRDRRGVEDIIARGYDNGGYLYLDNLVSLLKINGPGGAKLFTSPALTLQEISAVFAVDDRDIGYRLGERSIYRLPFTQPDVKLIVCLPRALFPTGSATSALSLIDIAGFLLNLDLKVANMA